MVLGEAVLSAFLQVLFDRLASRELLDFFRGRDLDPLLLKKLKVTLLSITAVLDDAEEKQMTNPLVKEWIVELKDAVYQAEDLLDLISTEALRCKVEKDLLSNSRQVWNYISNSLFPFDRNIESKMEEVIHRLEFIGRQTEFLGLKEVSAPKQLRTYFTTSLVDEASVYGREIDRDKIMDFLLSDDPKGNNPSIISIVGMGGVGKTTLAQLVYNENRVREQFALRAWVRVSQEFDVIKLTRAVLESVTLLTFDTEDLNQLQVRLKENLAGKKFLIVLDDLWKENYNDWDILQRPFKYGEKGSKIIITTRNANVASFMSTVPCYYLQQLSFEDCWSLFMKHAFAGEACRARPNLEVIGKEIVKQCKGLPLAAKTLGGLLRNKSDTEEWENVLRSDLWDLSSESCEILPALRLSYHYLPAHLKRCFAYCSIFPKSYIFDREKLVLLWMAEGLLQQSTGRKTMKELGDQYFHDLLSRSLFQQLDGGRESLFIMHDLINDLAASVSREFCLRVDGDHKQHRLFQNARHSSYMQQKYDGLKRFEVLRSAKNLRTFLPLNMGHDDVIYFISDKVVTHLLPTLTCLRVLSFSHYKISNLPDDSIGNLIYLRYLDLSHTAITRLPESVTNLYNLQILLLSFSYLMELPVDFQKLINLQHLDIRGTKLSKMPLNMGKLTELQILTHFVVGENSGSRIRELSQLGNLRGALSISKLQHVIHSQDALEASLANKPYLDELMLEWDGSNFLKNEMDVLDRLHPHRSLKKLTVKGYCGAKFPSWIGDPSYSKLVSLTLKNCKNCEALPPLGQLSFLKELTIVGMTGVKRVGPEFYGARSSSAKPFQSLETLRFEAMLEWEDWFFFDDGESRWFPHLEVLCLLRCPKLALSLPKLPSLSKLEIDECDQILQRGVSSLNSLDSLRVTSDLSSLPEDFLMQLKTLKELLISHCSKLTTLANQVEFECLSSLERLEISSCPKLMAFPPGLQKLINLKLFRIDGCPSLVSFPEQMAWPPMLTHLIVQECEALKSLPGMTKHNNNSSFSGLVPSSNPLHFSSADSGLPTTLKELRVMNCKKLEFPEGMFLTSTYLERLEIFGCHSLTAFPLIGFPNLTFLDISGCNSIDSLPNGLQNLTSLRSLTIMNCPLLCYFPNGGLPISSLTSLEIHYCDNLRALPHQMSAIICLQKLHISNCPRLTSFPEGGLPSNLLSIDIINCQNLIPNIEWALHRLLSLQHFQIARCPSLESFPDEWLLPASLSSLHIVNIPNLTSIPKALQYLPNLENLEIGGCGKLLFLPEGGLPTSVSSLHIRNCPMLRDRCLNETGEDWHKIKHIPCITIDYKLVS